MRKELEKDLAEKYGISGVQDVTVGKINEPKKFTRLTGVIWIRERAMIAHNNPYVN